MNLPRENTLYKTGYEIERKGKKMMSFEFDAKSFNN